MKKFFFFAVALLATVSFSACSDDDDDNGGGGSQMYYVSRIICEYDGRIQFITDFKYDEKNRLIEIKDVNFETPTTLTYDDKNNKVICEHKSYNNIEMILNDKGYVSYDKYTKYEYDDDGYLLRIIHDYTTEDTTLTWENGDLMEVNTDASSDFDCVKYEYTDYINNQNIPWTL